MDDDDEVPPIKVVAIGDGAVGKTCLLTVFSDGNFPFEYVPTVFHNTTKDYKMDDITYAFNIWDTAGQEDLDRLRPLSYRSADVFMICFSVMNPASFENIEFKWIPEIEHHRRTNDNSNNELESGHNGKVLLVGTKCDLRKDQNAVAKLEAEDKKPVSQEEINEYIEKLKTKLAKYQTDVPYIECSALKMINVNESFEIALKLSLDDADETMDQNASKSGGGCCTIL